MSDAQGSGDHQGQVASETEAQRRERERQEAFANMTAEEIRGLWDGIYLKKEVLDQLTHWSEADKLRYTRPEVTKKPRVIQNIYSLLHALQRYINVAASGAAAKFSSCEEYNGAFCLAANDVRELGGDLPYQMQIFPYLYNVRTFSVKVSEKVLEILRAKNPKEDEWDQDLWFWVLGTVQSRLHYERIFQQRVSVKANATATKSKRNRKKKHNR